eukprot:6650297-Prymnesium_polylepis.1
MATLGLLGARGFWEGEGGTPVRMNCTAPTHARCDRVQRVGCAHLSEQPVRRDSICRLDVQWLDCDVNAEGSPVRSALGHCGSGPPCRRAHSECTLHRAAIRLEAEAHVVDRPHGAVECGPARVELHLEQLAACSAHRPEHLAGPAASHEELAVRRLERLVLELRAQREVPRGEEHIDAAVHLTLEVERVVVRATHMRVPADRGGRPGDRTAGCHLGLQLTGAERKRSAVGDKGR